MSGGCSICKCPGFQSERGGGSPKPATPPGKYWQLRQEARLVRLTSNTPPEPRIKERLARRVAYLRTSQEAYQLALAWADRYELSRPPKTGDAHKRLAELVPLMSPLQALDALRQLDARSQDATPPTSTRPAPPEPIHLAPHQVELLSLAIRLPPALTAKLLRRLGASLEEVTAEESETRIRRQLEDYVTRHASDAAVLEATCWLRELGAAATAFVDTVRRLLNVEDQRDLVRRLTPRGDEASYPASSSDPLTTLHGLAVCSYTATDLRRFAVVLVSRRNANQPLLRPNKQN